MLKLMKTLFWLSAILLSVIILGSCLTTTEYVTVKPDYHIPPVREQLEDPTEVDDLGKILNNPGLMEYLHSQDIYPENILITLKEVTGYTIYYEQIVSEWESWGISVYETLEIPLPDSLQLIKDLEE